MPELLITLDGKLLQEYELKQRSVIIGRKHDSDVRLPAKAISRRHAQVFSVLGDFYLLDLNSRNGTFVNAKRIEKHLLQDGDVINIANYQLQYVDKNKKPA